MGTLSTFTTFSATAAPQHRAITMLVLGTLSTFTTFSRNDVT